jgi:hypothetical protein
MSESLWINPHTGKGWTDEEEKAFAEIQAASRLNRIRALHLWKRCRKNLAKALDLARQDYPPLTAAQHARDKKAKAAAIQTRLFKGQS